MSEVLVLTVIEADYQWDDNELVVKASDYDQLKAENEAYKKLHDWLKAENERLREENEEWAPVMQKLGDQNDALRKQLDEARELLAVASEIIHEQAIHIDRPMTDLGSEALTRLDDWLEANGK